MYLPTKGTRNIPENIDLFKLNNNKNTRKMCEICSKFTIKTRERVSLLLTLNIFHTFSSVVIADL